MALRLHLTLVSTLRVMSLLFTFQVRKLEFLMACALEDGYRHVITCGGIQSNHCRATAVAARQLGLKPHLVLRSDTKVNASLYFILSLACL